MIHDSEEEVLYSEDDGPSSPEEGPSWIRRPMLPVAPEDVWKLTDWDCPDMSVPRPPPASVVRKLFSLAPTLSSPDPFKMSPCDSLETCLMAVDPATGDSLLHAIVRAGNLRGLDNMFAGRRWPMHRLMEQRAFHLFMEHRNNAGDNALHTAARSGRIDMVRAVVRMFFKRDLNDGRELPDEFKWIDGNYGINKPYYPYGGLARRILFLDAENNARRTPGEEALALGHQDISIHLEEYLDKAYPRGERGDADYKEQLKEMARRDYHFFREEGPV
ncbi:hypothetical protein F5X68DRAFT_200749, partial [Plectosphaerella plurivora]